MSTAKTDPILITGAGGQVGSVSPAIVRLLLEDGWPVRAFVRTDGHRAASLGQAGAEVFVGDLLNVADVAAACAGHCNIIHSFTNWPRRREPDRDRPPRAGYFALRWRAVLAGRLADSTASSSGETRCPRSQRISTPASALQPAWASRSGARLGRWRCPHSNIAHTTGMKSSPALVRTYSSRVRCPGSR
ncbi:hypothetical protein MINTM021_10520 [Mycobacterium paraintracellulare]|nr:hypothetical protein MINTM021_10520 [Mycobacterium paraintracellulare]